MQYIYIYILYIYVYRISIYSYSIITLYLFNCHLYFCQNRMNLGNSLEPPLCGAQDLELWTIDSFQDFFFFFSTCQALKKATTIKDPLKSRPIQNILKFSLSNGLLIINFILFSSVKLSFKAWMKLPVLQQTGLHRPQPIATDMILL